MLYGEWIGGARLDAECWRDYPGERWDGWGHSGRSWEGGGHNQGELQRLNRQDWGWLGHGEEGRD